MHRPGGLDLPFRQRDRIRVRKIEIGPDLRADRVDDPLADGREVTGGDVVALQA